MRVKRLQRASVGPVFLCLLSLAVSGGTTPTAFAATPSCQFVLGFQTLRDLDPSDVGDCLDNQSFAPNGDALQHTSNGLMAWRKADNWTAFTNGYMTWINGPSGLASRLNSDRFPWEQQTAPNPSGGDYRQQAAQIVQLLDSSYTQVIGLLQHPQAGDPDWTAQITGLLAQWHVVYQQMQALAPPPELASKHSVVLSALAQFDSAATDLANGLQQQDSTHTQIGLQEMGAAVSLLTAASPG